VRKSYDTTSSQSPYQYKLTPNPDNSQSLLLRIRRVINSLHSFLRIKHQLARLCCWSSDHCQCKVIMTKWTVLCQGSAASWQMSCAGAMAECEAPHCSSLASMIAQSGLPAVDDSALRTEVRSLHRNRDSVSCTPI
jgi:hypothetical protein